MDTVGLKFAFETFQRISNKLNDVKLSGLEDFHKDKLFFTTFAMVSQKYQFPNYAITLWIKFS